MEHIKFKNLDLNDLLVKSYPNPAAKKPTAKGYTKHYNKLTGDINKSIHDLKLKSEKIKFNPYLVMKINLEDECVLSDKDIEKLKLYDLDVISNNGKDVQVVFSRDLTLEKFRNVLNNYKNQVKARTKVENEDLLNKIESICPWGKKDRVTFNYDELKVGSYLDCYLWVFDDKYESSEKMKQFKEDINKHANIRLCDSYVGNSIVIARVQIKSKKDIEILEEHPLIFKINLIKFNDFSNSNVREVLECDINEIEYDDTKINDTETSVCVIDSGINAQHPLFKNIIGEALDFSGEGNPYDEDGHGTAVASICAYGDILEINKFIPEIYINSAKIHNGEFIHPMWIVYDEFRKESKNLNCDLEMAINDYINELMSYEDLLSFINDEELPYFKFLVSKYEHMYDTLIPNTMRQIVKYFKETYDCTIFNLSQGNISNVYSDGDVEAWACALDEIQNEEDVLFIVSSGNYKYDDFVDDYRTISEEYPFYFWKDCRCRIIDPATSITSITVGGIAISDKIIKRNQLDNSKVAITKNKEIASMSRVGPGPLGAIKPEFVAYSGDNAYDMHYDKKQRNQGLEKIVFDIGDNLFKYDCGTSFSAPVITNIAGLIKKKYSNASSNLIRAIIASSAAYSSDMEEILNYANNYNIESISDVYKRKSNNKLKLSKPKVRLNTFGYGYPKKELCLDSLENRVALIADVTGDDAIEQEKVHIYEIPLPEKFRQAKGQKRVIVSLAYNPEVRKTRLDYKGSNLIFRLVKGQTQESVINGVTKVEKSETIKIDNKYFCDIDFVSEIRKGTLQKGVFKFNQDNNFTDNLYLVVESLKGWSKQKQNYSVVVVLESDDDIKIYEEVLSKVNLDEVKVNTEEKVKDRVKF
ncbi:Subtilase family protein [Clostridium perfringens]|uniref:S8 family peptidase n=1 Tax=Clostridium perfringens TaxID=1502 RepID=UPI001F05B3DC|nr:S8 family peptidase [Clostridium perfringens]MCH1962990.1 S8 family peptidase [Clostridium perfringens]MDG6883628.1 Subtilase family protein [Clostridium perfringens]